MRYQIVVTRRAKQDIRNAVAWWGENRSKKQAEVWYQRIGTSIETLTQNPDRCPLALETDLNPNGLRELHVGVGTRTTHRIVFTIDGDAVVILRVRHVAQSDLVNDDLTF